MRPARRDSSWANVGARAISPNVRDVKLDAGGMQQFSINQPARGLLTQLDCLFIFLLFFSNKDGKC